MGEEPPTRGGPPGAARSRPTGEDAGEPVPVAGARLTYDELIARAAARGEWRTLTLTLPGAADHSARIAIDEGNGGQPQLRHTLTLDTATGEVVAWAPFSSQTPGQRARSWIRFLHTGEALGLVGQTVAGLVSLTSVVMVWTGLALAWRRLLQPLFRRRRATPAASAA